LSVTDEFMIKLKLHNRRLKSNRKTQPRYFILLSDQTCIVGTEFETMRIWKRRYRDKPIADMFRTTKRVNQGVISLSNLIEYDPKRAME